MRKKISVKIAGVIEHASSYFGMQSELYHSFSRETIFFNKDWYQGIFTHDFAGFAGSALAGSQFVSDNTNESMYDIGFLLYGH